MFDTARYLPDHHPRVTVTPLSADCLGCCCTKAWEVSRAAGGAAFGCVSS